MKNLQSLVILTTSLLAGGMSVQLSAQEIYVLYSSETKALMRQVRGTFAGKRIRTCNAMLLAVSDYSGRQKMLAKFDCAKVVVILGVKAARSLKKARFARPVVMVNATTAKIKSKAALMHIISGATKPPKGVESEPVSSVGDMKRSANCVTLGTGLAMEAAIARAFELLNAL